MYQIVQMKNGDIPQAMTICTGNLRNIAVMVRSRIFGMAEKKQYNPIWCSKSSISRNGVFAAWDHDCLIGVTSVNVNQGYHFKRLTTTDSAYIESPGAFVRSEYRGKGVGAGLLKKVFDHRTEAGKSCVHVSFEIANPYANRFWPKYFRPAVRSVRRTINKDANDILKNKHWCSP
jgi:GNAT superfamily N-acetyltransferase